MSSLDSVSPTENSLNFKEASRRAFFQLGTGTVSSRKLLDKPTPQKGHQYRCGDLSERAKAGPSQITGQLQTRWRPVNEAPYG